jgi:inhibitor of nuclear factor kappa-B kinase subunit beta
MDDIMEFIEAKTGILKHEICLVLCLEQKLSKIDENTKPIDFYIPNFHDKPMLYIIRDKFLLQSIIKPTIPKSVADVFQNIKTKLKPHVLKHFITNAYFFIRNEQSLYVTALEGIKNYALHLNEEIVKYRPEVVSLNRLSTSMIGSIESHKIVLNHTKEKLHEKKVHLEDGPILKNV